MKVVACALAWVGRRLEDRDIEASCRCSHEAQVAAVEEVLSQVVLRREDMEAVVVHVAL